MNKCARCGRSDLCGVCVQYSLDFRCSIPDGVQWVYTKGFVGGLGQASQGDRRYNANVRALPAQKRSPFNGERVSHEPQDEAHSHENSRDTHTQA